MAVIVHFKMACFSVQFYGSTIVRLDSPLRHLIVDEYQDLNRCDQEVIKAFTARGSILYAAGDDDQSIYGFRHALPEGIREFDRDYSSATILSLTECHRCSEPVLGLARFIAQLDPRRKPKALIAVDPAAPGLVRLLRFHDQFQEATGVGALCRWLVQTRGCNPGDILILTRTDTNEALSSVIRNGIPEDIPSIRVEDPLALFDEAPGRGLLCALKLLINPEDHLAWRVWLAIRNNGIGPTILTGVYDFAREQRITFTRALTLISGNDQLLPRYGARLAQETQSLRSLIEQLVPSQREGLDTLVAAALDLLVPDSNVRGQLSALFEQMRAESEASNLQELLTSLQVSLGNLEQSSSADRVRIMTMHQAKGLTSRAVILVGLEDEFLPGRSSRTPQEDDERRLLYVSLTRAKEFLFITHCETRSGQQRRMGSVPGQLSRRLTRFLQDAPVQSENGIGFISRL